jgi:chromosome partitioning protein
MQTIALIAQKGGGGKTTLAVSLACAAEAEGLRTLIIDLDPQASACHWGDRRGRDAPAVVDGQPARLSHALARAEAERFALCIIDTPARIELAAAEAAKASSVILIPCRPGVMDVETVATTAELIRRSGAEAETAVILNACPPQGPRAEQAAEACRAAGLAVAGQLGHRAAFEYATQLGLSAAEYEPAGKAAAEIGHLYKSVCRLLDKSRSRHAETSQPVRSSRRGG